MSLKISVNLLVGYDKLRLLMKLSLLVAFSEVVCLITDLVVFLVIQEDFFRPLAVNLELKLPETTETIVKLRSCPSAISESPHFKMYSSRK